MKLKRNILSFCLFLFTTIFYNCKNNKTSFDENYSWNSVMVTATAYNSIAHQTDSNPHITAFGDSLKPGLKYIAVSRDLLRKGLKHNTPVKIEGLEGVYFVKDKMHSRWKNKIDIYMGLDVNAAKQWGRKKICIDYGIPIEN